MMSLRIELFVKNMEESVNFYTNVLGFEVRKQTPDYVSIHKGNAVIGLGDLSKLLPSHPLALKTPDERKGVGVEIVLEVEDIEDEYNRVSAQYPIETPLQRRSWGLTDFRILDPNGYFIRITSKS